MSRIFILLSLLPLIASCRPQMPVRHKRYITKAAKKDLQCPASALSIAMVKKDHYRVEGCNGSVAYKIHCKNPGPCVTEMTQVPTPIKKGE